MPAAGSERARRYCSPCSSSPAAAGPGKSPEQAKHSIVDFVEGSTGVVGDGWELGEGPGLGKCGLGLGQGGVQYVYA
ncbi:hypothetical protein DEI83_12705 [Curtobacterium sp. MCBD17_021]|nr:hypothetical protein DEI83_12705 [Curtobacterium sp. MCBD17_021]